MFGSHLSIAGGMHNALLSAEKYGMETVQVFTKNQKQWGCGPLEEGMVAERRGHCGRLKFTQKVSHGSYLISLASPNEGLWGKGVELFVEELRRCVSLGIPYLVTHPGAHMGEREAAGLKRVARALDLVHQQVPADGVVTCL